MFRLLKSGWNFIRSRVNTFQKAFTILGCIIGFVLALTLIITGIAAIPFTGGGSLLPAWAGAALFIVLVTGTFGSAGKYIGLSIDTLFDKEKLTNEKIATIAGCAVGLTISVLAIPLHFMGFGVSFIAEKAGVAAWEVLLPFIPLTMGTFGSACSYIGRSVDAFTNGKTIFDLFRRQPPQSIPAEAKEDKGKEKEDRNALSASQPLPLDHKKIYLHFRERMNPVYLADNEGPDDFPIRRTRSMPDLTHYRSRDIVSEKTELLVTERKSGFWRMPSFLRFLRPNSEAEKQENKIVKESEAVLRV